MPQSIPACAGMTMRGGGNDDEEAAAHPVLTPRPLRSEDPVLMRFSRLRRLAPLCERAYSADFGTGSLLVRYDSVTGRYFRGPAWLAFGQMADVSC